MTAQVCSQRESLKLSKFNLLSILNILMLQFCDFYCQFIPGTNSVLFQYQAMNPNVLKGLNTAGSSVNTDNVDASEWTSLTCSLQLALIFEYRLIYT